MKNPQPASQEELIRELVLLREEVQQLRQMVNMLLDMVVEPEEDDWDSDPMNRRGNKGGRNMMCM
ncbi:MAG: hypothetical protein ACUVV6_01910 [Thermoplasmatota archaeon]